MPYKDPDQQRAAVAARSRLFRRRRAILRRAVDVCGRAHGIDFYPDWLVEFHSRLGRFCPLLSPTGGMLCSAHAGEAARKMNGVRR